METDQQAPADGPEVRDGRRARRQRGRATVIDALFELLAEGMVPPTTDALVERSGVSLSSIFRYFESLDDMQEQTVETYFERFAPLFDIPGLGEGPLDERIKRLVDSRLDLYLASAPIARLARSRALERPMIGAALHQTREKLSTQVRTHFFAEVDPLTPATGADLVDLISLVTSFEAWDLLTDGGRTPRQIRRAWLAGLHSLLPLA